ncbi:MAG: hypothetical protein ABIO70_30600 [Pseudomonadota bacterium]
MLISLFSGGAWRQQQQANVKRGSNDNIFYLTLSIQTLEGLPEGHGSLRVALDGVEGLAVSPLGPASDGRGMEFIVVMPSEAGERRLRETA